MSVHIDLRVDINFDIKISKQQHIPRIYKPLHKNARDEGYKLQGKQCHASASPTTASAIDYNHH